ncbi:MAG: hypothetical protein NTZ20_04310 [Candidatus Levybacteria bacterium]|nr:hypothetical protein [Candidatus Levybacteria bacterium]
MDYIVNQLEGDESSSPMISINPEVNDSDNISHSESPNLFRNKLNTILSFFVNSNSKRILNYSSWILFFLLTPTIVIMAISQRSIPGERFYPLKRVIENIILNVASVNSSTIASIRIGLTDERLLEVEKLLTSNTSDENLDNLSLTDLLTEVESTQLAVVNVADILSRKVLQQKFEERVVNIEKKLIVIKEKNEEANPSFSLPTNNIISISENNKEIIPITSPNLSDNIHKSNSGSISPSPNPVSASENNKEIIPITSPNLSDNIHKSNSGSISPSPNPAEIQSVEIIDIVLERHNAINEAIYKLSCLKIDINNSNNKRECKNYTPCIRNKKNGAITCAINPLRPTPTPRLLINNQSINQGSNQVINKRAIREPTREPTMEPTMEPAMEPAIKSTEVEIKTSTSY